jgi:hypothetical protein
MHNPIPGACANIKRWQCAAAKKKQKKRNRKTKREKEPKREKGGNALILAVNFCLLSGGGWIKYV